MYKTIKKFLAEGGKCLLIEDGKPIGVVLTMEEYEILLSKPQITNPKLQKNPEPTAHPVGEVMAKEMDFRGASADLNNINIADSGDVTLEDLGLDELPY